jgi:hypothetical protein
MNRESFKGKTEPGNVCPLTEVKILPNAAGWASQGDLH